MKVEFAPGFQKSMNKLFSWKYAPLRAIKWVLRIPREIKWFFQRGFRGYADCDVWSLYSYILDWLPKALDDLNKHHQGYPAFLDIKDGNEDYEVGSKRWEEILKSMSTKLKRGIESDEKSLSKEDIAEFEVGMDLLKKYFFNLWD